MVALIFTYGSLSDFLGGDLRYFSGNLETRRLDLELRFDILAQLTQKVIKKKWYTRRGGEKKRIHLATSGLLGVNQGVTRARNRDQRGKMGFRKGSKKATKTGKMHVCRGKRPEEVRKNGES